MIEQNPYAPSQQQPHAPATDPGVKPAGFSAGALTTIVGALVALGSYFMTWYASESEPDISANGWGKVNNPDYVVETGKWHWALLAGAIVAVIVAVCRLLGRYGGGKWEPATIAVTLASLLGALYVFAAVPDGAVRSGAGLYVALLGGIVITIGMGLMRFTRH